MFGYNFLPYSLFLCPDLQDLSMESGFVGNESP